MIKDSSTSIPDQFTNCQNKLPCGVCLLTNKPCPIGFTKVEPTWTCETNAQTSGYVNVKRFGFQK